MGYRLIWENGREVDSIGNVRIDDLETAQRLASELSGGGRQGVQIISHAPTANSAGEWVDTNAGHYRDGKPYPAHWVIELGGLLPEDLDKLKSAGARHRHTIKSDGLPFIVEAPNQHEADALVREAIPEAAFRLTLFTSRPATDKEVIDDEMGM